MTGWLIRTEFDARDEAEEEVRDFLMTSFKDVPQGMLTLFQAMSGGFDWGELYDPLKEVGDWYRFLFLFFYFFTVLGILNIVTGLFCEGAAENARHERGQKELEEMRKNIKIQKAIRSIFKALDADGSGRVDAAEFQWIVQDQQMLDYFAQMSLDPSEVAELFFLLDRDCTGEVDIDEFVGGLMQIKGGASMSDLAMLVFEHRRLVSEFRIFRDHSEAYMA